MTTAAFLAEMARKRGSQPKTKIEYVTKLGAVTDISDHYLTGANLDAVKERAPDEIQSGQFDIVLLNHDDMFSEYKTGSLIGLNYHGDAIRIYQGFVLPDGTEEYAQQGVGYIDQLITNPQKSTVTLRCRDLLWRIMDQRIHARPSGEIPVPGGSNIGNGTCPSISTRPFYTINENWTLTCTTGGGDGVALFSVVGSVSGNVGTATSGTEFWSLSAGVKFTIHAGTLPFQVADVFTFSSYQHPEWVGVNVGKILWSVLTGYNWDSDTQEAWAPFVFNFDHTKSAANTDLDYDSFVTAIQFIDDAGVFDVHGFANYDTEAISFLQELITMVLGSLFTGNDGRIKFKVYSPQPGDVETLFKDSEKITQLSYNRSIDEVINSVVVNYIGTNSKPFSDESPSLDGYFSVKDSSSIAKYKELGLEFTLNWYTPTGGHAQDFATRLIVRYSKPPLNVEFETGMDALLTEIGDFISVTDEKLGLNAIVGEVASIRKQFDAKPTKISLMIRRDAVIEQIFGFVGSSVDEGDGISPQSDDFDTASPSDLTFAYVGNGVTADPDYRIY